MEKKPKSSKKPKLSEDFDVFEEGRDYEVNEQGLMIFTASYLKRRGYCCGNGCRHCPYQDNPDNKDKKNKKD